jgi:ribonuclease HI
MPWKPAQFKGKKVWVEVEASGKPVVKGGRMPMRYSAASGSKIYNAGVSGVMMLDEPAIEMDAGVAADSAKSASSRGSGFGKAGTRTESQAAAARVAAGELLASFHRDAVVCFTDGACQGNPGPAGSGAVVKLPDGRVLERHLALGRATNNIGELKAIDLAMDLLDEGQVSGDAPVEILTDSKYVHGLLQLGWKGKANQNIITAIKSRLRSFSNVRIHWIAGHVGIPENERADALANRGVSESLARR